MLLLKRLFDKLRKWSEHAPVAKVLAVKKAVPQTSQAMFHSQTTARLTILKRRESLQIIHG